MTRVRCSPSEHGPTHAQTSYIVGLQLTSPGGRTWTLQHQFGDLTHAEGKFTTPLGLFYALSGTVSFDGQGGLHSVKVIY
jgi:hypothetical protein